MILESDKDGLGFVISLFLTIVAEFCLQPGTSPSHFPFVCLRGGSGDVMEKRMNWVMVQKCDIIFNVHWLPVVLYLAPIQWQISMI